MKNKYRKDNGCIYNLNRNGEYIEKDYTDKPQPIGGVWDEDVQDWIIDETVKLTTERKINNDIIQQELKKIDWLYIRHLQQEKNNKTKLSEEQFDELVEYADNLRDYSNEVINIFPTKPNFIK